mmetsp:Transcript_6266/g.9492  ORF Transcript_6266/g.9492 Transcript_6266/m.9492 type:complete len:344 (+) Transcript_6266:726-1757(+)
MRRWQGLVCSTFLLINLYQIVFHGSSTNFVVGTNEIQFNDVACNIGHVLAGYVTKPCIHTCCFSNQDTPAEIIEKFATPQSLGSEVRQLFLSEHPPSEDLMNFITSFQHSAVNFLTVLYDNPIGWSTLGPFHDFIACNWVRGHQFFSHFMSLFPPSMGLCEIEQYDTELRWEEEQDCESSNPRVNAARKNLERRVRRMRKKYAKEMKKDPDFEHDDQDLYEEEIYLDPERDFYMFIDRHLEDHDLLELWSQRAEFWVGNERLVAMGDGLYCNHEVLQEVRRKMLNSMCHPQTWPENYCLRVTNVLYVSLENKKKRRVRELRVTTRRCALRTRAKKRKKSCWIC